MLQPWGHQCCEGIGLEADQHCWNIEREAICVLKRVGVGQQQSNHMKVTGKPCSANAEITWWSRDRHAGIMWIPEGATWWSHDHHSGIMITWIPCRYHMLITSPPCRNHAIIMWQSCWNHVSSHDWPITIMWRSCENYRCMCWPNSHKHLGNKSWWVRRSGSGSQVAASSIESHVRLRKHVWEQWQRLPHFCHFWLEATSVVRDPALRQR